MAEATDGSNYAQPTDDGHFGDYGGRFVAETLTHALDGLARLYNEVKDDPDFKRELHTDLRTLWVAPRHCILLSDSPRP